MNDALININKVQKHLNEMADNARDNGYPHEVEVIQSIQDNLLDFVEESRAALPTVDIEGQKWKKISEQKQMVASQQYQDGWDAAIDHINALGCFGGPDSEWFFRWIARGKAGYAGMTMEQCADMIWYSPDNPYRENNPWVEAAPREEEEQK